MLTGDSLTSEYFQDFQLGNIAGNLNSPDEYLNRVPSNLGLRYGLNPETAQQNGVFIIDELNGKISFSSDLKEKIITSRQSKLTFKYTFHGQGRQRRPTS